ncbi:MAG: PadR family transcriptional regulator, regulatory protein PadR [Sphingomonadales bacterium]|jgi:DNA-binding PadR family transcriptional regulator|nr:PadR family transcriptional regulator, regulatory protein PadR [Sphingomonadales bacterium]MEA3045146.1 PadR family transcriptional regulator, regulatory protein PadR [Sphingomonadales bacterium]
MKPSFRSTRPMRALLAALLAGSEDWRHGYDLSKETQLKSGTLYPLLMRFAERGWVEARWTGAAAPGRPPRHIYRLTAEGRRVAAEAAPATADRPLRLRPA